MKLHTVFVTYNRLELTKIAISSFFETVSARFSLCVVDNGSDDGTPEFLHSWLTEGLGWPVIALGENRYPGYACNRGWELAPSDATHLQRADNDFQFLPYWCEEVERRFTHGVGQVGLRTNEEELWAKWNVGGNNIIRRELWDQGLRYDETPWTEYPPGFSEDSYFSPAILEMGWRWRRVQNRCIRSLASGDWSDPYYQKSYGDRRIEP